MRCLITIRELVFNPLLVLCLVNFIVFVHSLKTNSSLINGTLTTWTHQKEMIGKFSIILKLYIISIHTKIKIYFCPK